MKKTLLFLSLAALLAFGTIAGAAAQQTLDSRIFDINLGFIGGYRLDDNAPVGGQRFSFDFNVADNVSTGIALTTFAGATPAVSDEYSTFLLKYHFGRLGMILHVGQWTRGAATDMASGTGFTFNLLETVTQNAIHTGLRINVEYIFNNTHGVDKGTVLVGLSGSFGI